MRSFIALIAGLALAATIPLAAQTAPPAPPAHAPHGHFQMPRPTNLQVLPKDISDKQLIATMVGFKHDLGVHSCSFCHAEAPSGGHLDFASDANPRKNIARTMIRMTEAINTKYLATVTVPDSTPAQKTVSCATCHRGHPIPPSFAAMEHEHPPMPHPAG